MGIDRGNLKGIYFRFFIQNVEKHYFIVIFPLDTVLSYFFFCTQTEEILKKTF